MPGPAASWAGPSGHLSILGSLWPGSFWGEMFLILKNVRKLFYFAFLTVCPLEVMISVAWANSLCDFTLV